MKRVVRYGATKSKRLAARDRWCGDFTRLQGSVVDVGAECKSEGSRGGDASSASYRRPSSYQPPITSISVNNSAVFDSFVARGELIAPLVLVGRSDGSVDLFRLDAQEPIQSWELSLYVKQGGVLGGGPAVVFVQWATWGDVGAFVAADATGNVFFFDILKQPNKPIFVDRVNAPLAHSSVQLSSCRSKGMSVFLAIGHGGSNATVAQGALRIRKIDDNVSAGTELDSAGAKGGGEEEVAGAGGVPPQWASWVGRTAIQVSPWNSN